MKKYNYVLLLLCHALSISGQQGQAILGGVVLDPITEDSLAYSEVLVLDQNDELVARHLSFDGAYQIKSLSPGVYDLLCYTFYGRRESKIIRNVVLKEGVTVWYPRLAVDSTPSLPLGQRYDPFFSDMQWEEEYEYKSLALYPNPAQNHFSLEAPEFFEEATIYDLNGKRINSFKAKDFERVDVSNLNRGLYLCVVQAPSWSYRHTLKFIKY